MKNVEFNVIATNLSILSELRHNRFYQTFSLILNF